MRSRRRRSSTPRGPPPTRSRPWPRPSRSRSSPRTPRPRSPTTRPTGPNRSTTTHRSPTTRHHWTEPVPDDAPITDDPTDWTEPVHDDPPITDWTEPVHDDPPITDDLAHWTQPLHDDAPITDWTEPLHDVPPITDDPAHWTEPLHDDPPITDDPTDWTEPVHDDIPTIAEPSPPIADDGPRWAEEAEEGPAVVVDPLAAFTVVDPLDSVTVVDEPVHPGEDRVVDRSIGHPDPPVDPYPVFHPPDLGAPPEEPVPAYADHDRPVDDDLDGLRLASPPIKADPEELAPVDDHADLRRAPIPDAPEPRTWNRPVALLLAVLVGTGLGILGAVALAQLATGDDPDTARAQAETAADEGEQAAAAGLAPPVEPTLELASLRFARGSDAVRLADGPAYRLLAESIERDPDAPITATVRTYTEATAGEDLALSRRQAEALEAQLVELGAAPGQVSVSALGRSLLTSAQPVANFVVASAGLGNNHLAELARDIGPFAIGTDRSSGELREESHLALVELAQAMVDDPTRPSLTLAAYNYDGLSPEANDARAAQAADAAVDHLVAMGIDRSRISVIVAGDEPFAVTDEVANHIEIRWGGIAADGLALDGLGLDGVDFVSGTAALAAEGASSIDGLADLLAGGGVDVVIDVQSYDADDAQGSVDLSVVRARAVGEQLISAGAPADRIHLHGSASRQFGSENRSARLVVTLLPVLRS